MSVENRNEVAFCGILCGRCIKGREESKKRAAQILEDMKESNLDSWQQHEPKQEPFDYDDLKKGLRWLSSLDCDGCHSGDGYPDCIIRKCAEEKKLENCGECSEMPCDIVRKAREKMGIDVEANFKQH